MALSLPEVTPQQAELLQELRAAFLPVHPGIYYHDTLVHLARQTAEDVVTGGLQQANLQLAVEDCQLAAALGDISLDLELHTARFVAVLAAQVQLIKQHVGADWELVARCNCILSKLKKQRGTQPVAAWERSAGVCVTGAGGQGPRRGMEPGCGCCIGPSPGMADLKHHAAAGAAQLFEATVFKQHLASHPNPSRPLFVPYHPLCLQASAQVPLRR